MNLAAFAAPVRPLTLWAPIGLEAPQSLIEVSLETQGATRDVTGRQVVLSLVPLVIGIGTAAGEAPRASAGASLVFRDRARAQALGTLRLGACPARLLPRRRIGPRLPVFPDARLAALSAGAPRPHAGFFDERARTAAPADLLHLPAARFPGLGRGRRARKPVSHGPGRRARRRPVLAGAAHDQSVHRHPAQLAARRVGGRAAAQSRAGVFARQTSQAGTHR